MVGRIGACCLVFSLAGLSAARPDELALRSSHAIPDLAPRLLRLHESLGGDDREPRLASEAVAEVFPELVDFDAEGRPKRVRYRRLASLLLGEVRRLADRVAELERERPPEARGSEPIIRITVARDE